jgi:hypothetical protein
VKSAENFFTALRREKTLDIADKKNQDAQQQGDFDHVIDEELQAANPTIGRIEPKRSK